MFGRAGPVDNDCSGLGLLHGMEVDERGEKIKFFVVPDQISSEVSVLVRTADRRALFDV